MSDTPRAIAGEAAAADLLAQWEALNLRVAGGSVSAIADQMRRAPEDVARLLRAAYRRLAEMNPATASEARELDLARYDEMLLVLWARVRKGDLASIREARAIMRDRQALGGYGAPARVEVTGKAGGPIEVTSWSSLMSEVLQDEDRERASRALPS